MAKKSTNTQGNPWHSEENGQFVSKNETASSSTEENEAMGYFGGNPIKPVSKNMKLGTIDKIKDFLQKNREIQEVYKNEVIEPEVENETGIKKATTVEEAEMIGNQIFGRNCVFYEPGGNVDYMNQCNQALYDVHKDFPELFHSVLKFGSRNRNIDKKAIQRETNERMSEIAKSLNLESNLLKNIMNKLIRVKGRTSLTTRIESTLNFSLRSGSRKYGKIQNYPLKGEFVGKMPPSAITIQPDYFINTQTIERSHQNDIKTKYHEIAEKGFGYQTTSHELGHLVSLTLMLNFFDNEENNEIKAMVENVRQNIVPSVSYAHQDIDECIAEAFADAYSNTKPVYQENAQIVEYFKKKYKKYFNL